MVDPTVAAIAVPAVAAITVMLAVAPAFWVASPSRPVSAQRVPVALPLARLAARHPARALRSE